MARPREFDREQALNDAMQLFWQHGYEGTSLEQLTQALGIARPSLYAAFGNKEGLYLEALDRYAGAMREKVVAAMAEPALEDAVRGYLEVYLGGDRSAPPGCFLVNSALVCSPEGEAVKQQALARRGQSVELLLKRCQRASKRELGGASAAVFARLVSTIAQGLVMQGLSGMGRAQRDEVVELALTSLFA